MGTVSGTSNVGVIVGSGAKTEIIIENVYTTNTKSTYGTAASENANPVAYKGIATVLTKDALTGNNAYKNTFFLFFHYPFALHQQLKEYRFCWQNHKHP